MVARNRQALQKQKGKQAKQKSAKLSKMEQGIFEGRNVFLSVLCWSVSLIFLFFFGQVGENETMFWLTVVLYFVFGLYFFFVKRPYIKVSQSELAIKRLGKVRTSPASDVEKITVQPGYVIIAVKGRRGHLIFSRFFNRYDTEALASRLQDFAQRHQIKFVREINS